MSGGGREECIVLFKPLIFFIFLILPFLCWPMNALISCNAPHDCRREDRWQIQDALQVTDASKGLLASSFGPALKNTTKLGPWWSQDPGEITDVISKDHTHTELILCKRSTKSLVCVLPWWHNWQAIIYLNIGGIVTGKTAQSITAKPLWQRQRAFTTVICWSQAAETTVL